MGYALVHKKNRCFFRTNQQLHWTLEWHRQSLFRGALISASSIPASAQATQALKQMLVDTSAWMENQGQRDTGFFSAFAHDIRNTSLHMLFPFWSLLLMLLHTLTIIDHCRVIEIKEQHPAYGVHSAVFHPEPLSIFWNPPSVYSALVTDDGNDDSCTKVPSPPAHCLFYLSTQSTGYLYFHVGTTTVALRGAPCQNEKK